MATADRQISLRAFKVSTNGVDLKTGLPSRLKLLDWGANRINTGETYVVDEISAKVFADNQSRCGRETVPVDYEHHTVENTPAYLRTKPSDPVAGYGKPVVIAGEGLFLENIETTPDGLVNAANFKDLSPAPWIEDGRVVGMHSVALTVAGAVDNLTLSDAAVATLNSKYKLATFSTDSIPNAYKNGATNNQGFNAMDLKTVRELDTTGETKGMSDEATIAWVIAKWCGMCGKEGSITNKMNSTTPTWDDAWGAKPADMAGEIKTLTATVTALTAELDNKKTSDAKSEKASIIAQAGKEGKPITLTAEQLDTFSPDQLRVMVAAIPAGLVPRGPLKQIDPKDATIKPLSAMTSAERAPILGNLRARSLDIASALVAKIKSGQSVTQ